MSKISMSQLPFYRKFFIDKNGPRTSLQATVFAELFDKNFSSEILHKLAKYHYKTVLTSQVVQENAFLVPCWGIWCQEISI